MECWLLAGGSKLEKPQAQIEGAEAAGGGPIQRWQTKGTQVYLQGVGYPTQEGPAQGVPMSVPCTGMEATDRPRVCPGGSWRHVDFLQGLVRGLECLHGSFLGGGCPHRGRGQLAALAPACGEDRGWRRRGSGRG